MGVDVLSCTVVYHSFMQLKKNPSNLRCSKTLEEAQSPELSEMLLPLGGLQGLVLDSSVVIFGGAFTVLTPKPQNPTDNRFFRTICYTLGIIILEILFVRITFPKTQRNEI